MDLDDGVPFLLGHREEHPVAEDAGVVDEDVQPPERLSRLPYEPLAAIPGGHVVRVGHGAAAVSRDLVHDLLRRTGIATGSFA